MAQSDDGAVDRLRADSSRLVIVAHSMGTLFAIDSVVKCKADALFLLNPLLSLRLTRPLAQRLTVPTRVYLSEHDEMVSPRAARWFAESHDVTVTILPKSGHYHYPEPNRSHLLTDFTRFLAEF